MRACCVSFRPHHCQHAIISSFQHGGCDLISAGSCQQGSAPHAMEQMAADFLRAARAMRRARNNRNMRVARTDDRTGLSHVCLHTAVCIGLLASCDMRAGVVWLESANRRGKAWREDLSSAEVLQRLQHFFMEADLDFLDELRDPTRTSLSAAAFATAARAAEEYKLGGWCGRRIWMEPRSALRDSLSSTKGASRNSRHLCLCAVRLGLLTALGATGLFAGVGIRARCLASSAPRLT